MTAQLLTALGVTLLATSYLIWSILRPWLGAGKSGCGGCGSCGPKPPAEGAVTFIPADTLTLRSSRSGG